MYVFRISEEWSGSQADWKMKLCISEKKKRTRQLSITIHVDDA